MFVLLERLEGADVLTQPVVWTEQGGWEQDRTEAEQVLQMTFLGVHLARIGPRFCRACSALGSLFVF